MRPVASHPSPHAPGYLEPYRDAVDRHGATFEATLWASRDHQRTRFHVIVEMIDLAGAAVLDAGCGLGDFPAYLHERGVAYASCIGLEAVPEIAAAAERRSLPRCVIRRADFLHDERALADAAAALAGAGRLVIVFSGSLNTMRESDARRVLERAWRAIPADPTGALVFNFLSGACCRSIRSQAASPARRFSPQHMADWALAHTPRIRFRSDYFPGGHDATIVMWRTPEPTRRHA